LQTGAEYILSCVCRSIGEVEDTGVLNDFSGHDTSIIDIIIRGREHLKNHGFMFSLGERANILKVLD
jgi:hypothetical protein